MAVLQKLWRFVCFFAYNGANLTLLTVVLRGVVCQQCDAITVRETNAKQWHQSMSLNAAPIDLRGKTCLVTGASGGIGAAAVAHFAALGAHVYATDLAPECEGDADYKSFDLLSDTGLAGAQDWIGAIVWHWFPSQ
jgi:hypothetical protein